MIKRFPDHPERRPAVVIGASSGIGRAAAIALAEAGLPVALGARRVDKLEELAEQIRGNGGEAFVHAIDISSDDSVAAFAAACREALGDIEVVVASAALVEPGAIAEVTSERISRELDLNITGTHRLISAFVPSMIERRRGDFVFVSSDVANRARPMMAAYTASKWGVEGLAAAMQMELEGSGVRASIVRPGPTLTEMGHSWDPDETARVLNSWVGFGHTRHDHFMPPDHAGAAIATIVTAPRGVHLNLVEVSPEAPVKEDLL